MNCNTMKPPKRRDSLEVKNSKPGREVESRVGRDIETHRKIPKKIFSNFALTVGRSVNIIKTVLVNT